MTTPTASTQPWRLILASQSPARLDTLRRAGLDPEVQVSEVDESAWDLPDPAQLSARLAQLKAEAVYDRLASPSPVVVVGCDSILSLDGQACGKPGSPEAAAALWRRTSGRSAILVTGHHLIVADPEPRRATRVAQTVVHFAGLDDAEIAAYVATGEPERVAGGFTIDGLGGPFISGLEGDPHNVVGLSLPLLRLMLADLGVAWTSLWP
ncbi:MAG: Maf family nucleotide pyrophosphatase [Propionibacteriaceae bacterium]|nr:Maf family nucleotide pyrophosphatase [Propionibacteriaceae bacterium]